jgi:hypothetical protein
MNNAVRDLPQDVRSEVDTHLDGLERVLMTAGLSRAQRQEICDDVELQIREMLLDRFGDSPTAEQTSAVLAELDPPEAFLNTLAETESTPRTRPAITVHPRIHRFAVASAIVPVLGVLTLFTPLGRVDESQAIALMGCVEVLAIILAYVSIREIRRNPQRWSGLGLAVFGLLAIPISVGNLLAYLLLAPHLYHNIAGKSIRAGEVAGRFEQELTAWNRAVKDVTDRGEMNQQLRLRQEATLAQMKSRLHWMENENKDFHASPYKQFIFRNRGIIEVVTYLAAMCLAGTASVLSYLSVYRRCAAPSIRSS